MKRNIIGFFNYKDRFCIRPQLEPHFQRHIKHQKHCALYDAGEERHLINSMGTTCGVHLFGRTQNEKCKSFRAKWNQAKGLDEILSVRAVQDTLKSNKLQAVTVQRYYQSELLEATPERPHSPGAYLADLFRPGSVNVCRKWYFRCLHACPGMPLPDIDYSAHVFKLPKRPMHAFFVYELCE